MQRVGRVRDLMQEAGVRALVVSTPENRLYCSGFSGSAGLLAITGSRQVLVTDSRYTRQAAQEAQGWEIRERHGPLVGLLHEILGQVRGPIGFEAQDSHAFFRDLVTVLSCREKRLVPLDRELLRLRAVKDPGEISCIREAARITDAAFARILPEIRPGRTEREIARELEIALRREGAEGPAFPIIVASGERSSLPHGSPSDKMIGAGEFVLLDAGGVFGRYRSDLTRTWALGRPSRRMRDVYQVVREAHSAALSAVRAGVPARDVDRAARKVITRHHHGKHFGHGVGHGLGLAIHEEPSVSERSETVLAEDMILTIEPGVYIPGAFGVRIEDLVRVRADGCEVLSRLDRDLHTIGA